MANSYPLNSSEGYCVRTHFLTMICLSTRRILLVHINILLLLEINCLVMRAAIGDHFLQSSKFAVSKFLCISSLTLYSSHV